MCKSLIKKFDAVSVRVDSGLKFCKEMFNIDASQIVDPTLLLSFKKYWSLTGIKGPQRTMKRDSEKVLFSYVLDKTEDKTSIIESLTKSNEYLSKEIYLGDSTRKTSVESWIMNFMDADFIFTDSFHGCVFAVLFSKPFIAYGNKERGFSRFESLLKVLKLEDRIVVDKGGDILSISKKPINWEQVEALLEIQKDKSIRFINSAFQ